MERDYSAIGPQEVFKTLQAKKSRRRAPAKDERDLHITLAGFLLYSRRNLSEQQFQNSRKIAVIRPILLTLCFDSLFL